MAINHGKTNQSLKIDVLLPDSSLYDVLHHFSRKIYEAFQRAGCLCRLLQGDQRYTIPLQSPPDLTIGFNGALKIEANQLFCDYTKIPHIACLVDPPFRFMELTASPNIILTCDDAYCCEYFKKNYFPNTHFMPHAVEKELALQKDNDKIYDVVMLATFVDCENHREKWKDKFSKNICKAMQEAVETTLTDNECSFISALDHTLKAHADQPLEPSQLKTIFSEVEMYIKGRDKLDLLKSITAHQVHVFGNSIDDNNWKNVCQSNSNIIVHPGVPFLEAIEIMKRSKIVLNSCIKNKNGAHERIFSGSAAGAIVVTNENTYVRQHFTDENEILLYRRSAFHELNDRIGLLLNNESRRQEMNQGMRAKILAQHTWDHRIVKLLDDLKN